MKNTPKSKLLAIGLVAAIALGLVGAAGVALAQDPGEGTDAHQGSHPHRGHKIRLALREVAAVSGLEPEVFKEGFKAGQSINEVLAANGVDNAQVQAESLAAFKDRLDALVAAGTISQADADAAFARAEEALPKLMGRTPTPGGHGHKVGRIVKGALDTAADTIGISPADLVAGLQGDKTIANVAADNGVDPQAVVDALVAEASGHVDAAVEKGRLTEAEGGALKQKLPERVSKFVNETPDPRKHAP